MKRPIDLAVVVENEDENESRSRSGAQEITNLLKKRRLIRSDDASRINAYTIESTASHNAILIEGVSRSVQRIETGTILLKRRGDRYKHQLRVAMRQVSDISLQSEEVSKRLQEKILMLEEKNRRLEEAKEKAEDRWHTGKGELKAVLQKLKDVKSQNAYVEALLAFEERSGFSTLVSEMQLQ